MMRRLASTAYVTASSWRPIDPSKSAMRWVTTIMSRRMNVDSGAAVDARFRMAIAFS
jgi:hypothetical protein